MVVVYDAITCPIIVSMHHCIFFDVFLHFFSEQVVFYPSLYAGLCHFIGFWFFVRAILKMAWLLHV